MLHMHERHEDLVAASTVTEMQELNIAEPGLLF